MQNIHGDLVYTLEVHSVAQNGLLQMLILQRVVKLGKLAEVEDFAKFKRQLKLHLSMSLDQ